MKWPYVLLVLVTIFVSTTEPIFDFSEENTEDVRELNWKSTDSYLPYLKDKQNRVDDKFVIPSYFFSSVHFWFLMYTRFTSNQVVLHDRENMSLIYKVLDFSSLHRKGLGRNVTYLLQQKIADEKLKELRGDLDHLVKDPFSLEDRAKAIYRILKQADVAMPVNRAQRVKFFRSLKNNLRSQTGQKDHIRDGLKRSRPYQHFLTSYFRDRSLPVELLAIPFLESSFNPRAHSKAKALGVWQFMPFIANHFVPKRTRSLDYRLNVGVSSVSAAFLMAQNYRILKRWDLAVTAYNSGTRHLLKTKLKLGSGNVSLEDIISKSTSKHFGFASKNFYSEFLALAHTLAYQEELFPELKFEDRHDAKIDLSFYLTKCALRLDKILTKDQLEDLVFYNHHIRGPKKTLPRGTIITAKSTLPKGRFLPVPRERLLKDFPKKWIRILRSQSCSTR